MIGVAPSIGLSLSSRVNSRPSMPGSWRSIRIRSGRIRPGRNDCNISQRLFRTFGDLDGVAGFLQQETNQLRLHQVVFDHQDLDAGHISGSTYRPEPQ